MAQLICHLCKKQFNRTYIRSKRNFCSLKCKNKWLVDHCREIGKKKQIGQKNHRWKRIKRNCDYCRKEFERAPSLLKNWKNIFCDRECYSKWYSENIRGKKHPSWKGGWESYGPNWYIERKKTLKRDEYKCFFCNEKEDLCVHHIIPFLRFKYKPKENDNYLLANNQANLLTVCRSCHNKTEGTFYGEWAI